jgi:hypothetical protein
MVVVVVGIGWLVLHRPSDPTSDQACTAPPQVTVTGLQVQGGNCTQARALAVLWTRHPDCAHAPCPLGDTHCRPAVPVDGMVEVTCRGRSSPLVVRFTAADR